MQPRSVSSDGVVAALPIAAGFAILLARWLPIRFEYVPNDLGIVSLATLARYPAQQEMFWYVYALAACALGTWGLARVFRRSEAPIASIAWAEMAGGAGLLAVLWLPVSIGVVGWALAAGAAFWILSAGGTRPSGPVAIEPLPAPQARRPRVTWAWVAGALVLALMIAPGFWIGVWRIGEGIADERLVSDGFTFLGETGQHLAWTNSIFHGGFQGRDFFCLYGPLYDLGILGFWSLFGRSIAAYSLYLATARTLGWICLFLLGGAIVRRPLLVLGLPFLLPWVKFRLGLALLGILFLVLWLRGGRLRWTLLAGVVSGTSLLYSQEYGAALVVVSALAFVVRREVRGAALYGLGAAAVAAPVLIWFAANDALLPMLHDLVQYPRYLMAGYAKMIFPSLVSGLPLVVSELSTESSLALRLSYAVPAVSLGALMLALPVSALDPRRPIASMRELGEALARDPARLTLVLIAIFGLIVFRVALGRSSLPRTLAVLPAAVLLLGFGFDRLVDLWRRGSAFRPLAASRTLALVLLVAVGGFLEPPYLVTLVKKTASNLTMFVTHREHPFGNRHVMRVVRWIQLHTDAGEPVLFLPDDGAYYYLSDRPNPIRFVMGHQIVTDEHRAEVLRDLRANPPRYVVWDDDAYRVDDLPDELVFGPAILAWIDEHYRQETRIGGVEIRRRIDPGG